MKKTIVTHLEMVSTEQLQATFSDDPHFRIDKMETKQWQVNRFLYQFIGEAWRWVDKLTWPDQQWQDYVAQEQLHTFIARHHGAIAGYYELNLQENQHVELLYFGLAPQFIGKGFGGHLLSQAVNDAWSLGAKRVWLHTCTDDHPHALANYKSRGFKIFKIIEV